MALWLDAIRAAAGLNLILLAAMGGVWLRNYLSYRARHTFLLLVFAAVLFVQNILWLYFYTLHGAFIGGFLSAGIDIKVGIFALCGLELVGLAVLASFTLR